MRLHPRRPKPAEDTDGVLGTREHLPLRACIKVLVKQAQHPSLHEVVCRQAEGGSRVAVSGGGRGDVGAVGDMSPRYLVLDLDLVERLSAMEESPSSLLPVGVEQACPLEPSPAGSSREPDLHR